FIGAGTFYDFNNPQVGLGATIFVIASISLFVLAILILVMMLSCIYLGAMAYAIEKFNVGEKGTVKNMLKAGIMRYPNIFTKMVSVIGVGLVLSIPLIIIVVLNIKNFSSMEFFGMSSLFNAVEFFGIYFMTILLFAALSICCMFVFYIAAFRKHSIIDTFKYNFKIMGKKLHWLKFIGYSLLFSIGFSIALQIIIVPLILIVGLLSAAAAVSSILIVFSIAILVIGILVSIAALTFYLVCASSFEMMTFSLMEKETFIV
ncbi:MAG: hypothetical protein RR436_06670, partial [Clostridia bacterium]